MHSQILLFNDVNKNIHCAKELNEDYRVNYKLFFEKSDCKLQITSHLILTIHITLPNKRMRLIGQTYNTYYLAKLIIYLNCHKNKVYQSPLILTELFQHNLINVTYLTACYLYQVMMTLHFLNDVANDAESTQK